MAMVREWRESMDDMSAERAGRIREALWTLCNEWDLFTSEFPDARRLLHLMDDHMESSGRRLATHLGPECCMHPMRDEGEYWECRRCGRTLAKDPDGCGPEVPEPNHTQDEDCTLDDTGTCICCGVYHGDPCAECGGRGYHRPGCEAMASGEQVSEGQNDGWYCPWCDSYMRKPA